MTKTRNTGKKQVNNMSLEPESEYEARNKKKYEVKAIIDSAIYDPKGENQLLGGYYLVLWKIYYKRD